MTAKRLNMKWILMLVIPLSIISACRKEKKPLRYFEVGINSNPGDWRDTSFVVATNNADLLSQIEDELDKPLDQRKKLVTGKLVEGSGGYNKNAGHSFNWHFDEDKWELADFTIEIIDGLPYTDVHVNHAYWMDTVKSFGSWGSYIKRELTGNK